MRIDTVGQTRRRGRVLPRAFDSAITASWAGVFCTALVFFGGLFAIATHSEAQSLDAQRQSGAIGERYDGFAVAREGSAEGAARKINAERTALYQERAAKQGVSAEAVGRVYAKKIFERAPAGTWFLTEQGSWIKK